MEAFTCDKCQTIHNYDKIESVTLCDACKKVLTGTHYECIECYDEEVEPVYHKGCLVKLDDSLYCSTHRVKKEKSIEAATIIRKYAEEFWAELGGKVIEYKDKQRSRQEFRVSFEALTLQVNLIPESKNGMINDDDDNNASYEIIALNHEVSGIKASGSSTFRAGIHNHQDALEQVASAMIRSLRSKKSAITMERNYVEASRNRGIEYAKEYETSRKRKQRLEEIQKEYKSDLSTVLAKRRKINTMSKFLVAKLEEIKKVPQVNPVVAPVLA